MKITVQTVDVLNRIPIVPWVLGTVERIVQTHCDDSGTWNRCWYEQYEALGGTKSSGAKPCPRAAARGLWLIGRLRGGQRPLMLWTPVEVYRNKELGKNAAYAVIAADLLATGPLRSAAELWPLVQSEFRRITSDDPADSEQGEVRLVVALFRSQKLIS